MKILKMDIVVDKLPDGCNIDNPNGTVCVFNQDKYCVLKMSLKKKETFVHNNRGVIPSDCPLREEKANGKSRVFVGKV